MAVIRVAGWDGWPLLECHHSLSASITAGEGWGSARVTVAHCSQLHVETPPFRRVAFLVLVLHLSPPFIPFPPFRISLFTHPRRR